VVAGARSDQFANASTASRPGAISAPRAARTAPGRPPRGVSGVARFTPWLSARVLA